MSILIKGVEMPTDHPLWIVIHSDGTVEANEVSQSRPVGWQTLRNAAVPVPPHGRLIDADAALKLLRNLGSRDYRREKGTIMDAMKMLSYDEYTPTIIEAEEGEL